MAIKRGECICKSRGALSVLLGFLVLLSSVIIVIAADGAISFESPSPTNGSSQTDRWVELNLSFTESSLGNLVYNWNNSNNTLYDSTLILMMNFDNVSSLGENGTAVKDLSVYSNNGTRTGALGVSGKYDSAYWFDGDDDKITVPSSASFNTTTQRITVSAWIKADAWKAGSYQGSIICNDNWADTNTHGFCLRCGASGKLDFVIGDGDASWHNAETAALMSAGEWTHVAGVYDGTAIRTYINGIERATTTVSLTIDPSFAPLNIGWGGYSDPTRQFNGTIDEVRIWNRSLSNSEIYQEYISNLKRVDSSEWYLYVNQSKNATDELDYGTYEYYAIVADTDSNINLTGSQVVTVYQEATPPQRDPSMTSSAQNLSEWPYWGRTLDNARYYPGAIPASLDELDSYFYDTPNFADALALSGGYVYGISEWSYLHKLNASNVSQQLQQVSFSGYPAPTIVGTNLYTPGYYTVRHYNTTNISTTINAFSASAYVYSPALVWDGYIYYNDWYSYEKVYQANANNITEQYEYYSCNNGDMIPAIANGYLYQGCSYTLNQLNASNVSQRIAYFSLGSGGFSNKNSVFANSEYAYIGNDVGVLYQLNASDVSQMIASYNTGGNIYYGFASAHGYLYATSQSGYIFQFDLNNISQPVANYSGVPSGSPIVTDDYVVFPNSNGITILDAQNISIQIANRSASGIKMILIADGMFYYGTSAGIYQLGTPLPVASTRSPLNEYQLNPSGETLDFTCSAYCSEGLENMSLYVTDSTNSNFAFNQTVDLTGQTANTTTWSVSLSEGNYTWNCLVYDNESNYDWGTNKSIIPDVTSPSVDIVWPADVYNTSDTGLDVNYTVSDPNLDSCWYFNGTTNVSLGSCVNITAQVWSEGTHNVTVFANDTLGNIGTDDIYFNIDLSPPLFDEFNNQSIGEERALSYTINATDLVGVDCYTVNDSDFQISCAGVLENNTILDVGVHTLNITVNDTLGNSNWGLLLVNVTLVGRLAVEYIYPTTAINASQNELFNVTVNVSCNRADCGNVNVTLSTYVGNESDIDIALVCYNSGCTDVDDLMTYLSSQGFPITANPYSGWSDSTLNSSYDVGVCAGYSYYPCRYGFDSPSDPPRDAYENEQLPFVSIADYAHAPYYLGITSATGTYDSADDNIINISNHNIMTGFSGTVPINTYSQDIGYLSVGDMVDPYTPLFAYQDGGGDEISGFALNAGQATVGTNPQRFVYLGFDVYDTYPYASGNDAQIIKQSICWASTGSYDCSPKTALALSGTPFYVDANRVAVNLNQSDFEVVTFLVNATGTVGETYQFITDVIRTEDTLVTNSTDEQNITIDSATSAPTITMLNPSNGTYTTNTALHINYTVSGDVFACWYNNGTTNVTSGNCTNITSETWSEGQHTIIVYSNSSTSEVGSAQTTFTIDTISPVVNISSPANGTYSTNSGLDIVYYVTESNLDTCWYNNGTTNLTLAGCANITTPTWTDGTHTIVVYVNDSAGQVSTDTVTFIMDTTAPTLNIVLPANGTYSTDAGLDVAYEVSDTNLDTCGYNNGTANITLSNCENVTNVTWSVGTHSVVVYAHDLAGHLSTDTVTFTIDTTAPIVNITSPLSGAASSDNTLDVEYTITDDNADSCWYNNGTANVSLGSCTNITAPTWADGVNTVTVYVNDSTSQLGTDTVNFTIDTAAPTTTLIAPTDATATNNVGIESMLFNCSAVDTTALANISLYITDNTNSSFAILHVTTVSGTSADAQWTVNLSNGNYTWNCLVKDSVGNTDWATNRTLEIHNDPDADADGLSDDVDNLLYDEDDMNTSGVTNLQVTVNDSGTNESYYNGTYDVEVYDGSDEILNFTHNFSESDLDLSEITIIKDTNSIIVNMSTQMQSDKNKTIFIRDNSFIALCVKDAPVGNINDVSAYCNGTNETNFTDCIGGNLTANGFECTDDGSRFRIKNLRHSAVVGTPAATPAPTGSGGSTGGSGGTYTITREEVAEPVDDPRDMILPVGSVDRGGTAASEESGEGDVADLSSQQTTEGQAGNMAAQNVDSGLDIGTEKSELSDGKGLKGEILIIVAILLVIAAVALIVYKFKVHKPRTESSSQTKSVKKNKDPKKTKSTKKNLKHK